MKSYMDVEHLEVYQKLCRLQIENCIRFTLATEEIRNRLANSPLFQQVPGRLAEKNDVRHSIIRSRE